MDEKHVQLPNSPRVKVSFGNKTFKVDEENHTVSCTLDCKIRLDVLEQHTKTFSQVLLKKVIGKYLKLRIKKLKANYRLHTQKDGETGEISVIKFTKADNYLRFKYEPGFQVTSTTTCDERDTFDKAIGKKVAENKAKVLAYQFAMKILEELGDVYETGRNICQDSIDKFQYLSNEKKEWLKKF